MNIYALGARRVEFAGAEWFVAPGAQLIGSVTVHDQASIWFNAVIRADNDTILIGARSNVQDGAVLHVDPGFPLTIGRNVCIGHKAALHGCTLGEGSLIGMNSVILNGAQIGRQSIVGAGALVAEGKQFPDRVVLLGAPAKVVREVTDKEAAWIEQLAEGYVQRARQYRAGLAPQAIGPEAAQRA